MTKKMPERIGSSKKMLGTTIPGVIIQVDLGTTSVLNYGAIPGFVSRDIRTARLSQMRTIFKVLQKYDVPTHLVDLNEGYGVGVREVRVQDLPLLSEPVHGEGAPWQIGLEVLIRTRISAKFLGRIKRGEVDRHRIILADGEELKVGAKLAVPYVEFSAKWIEGDPYLSDEKAMEIGEIGPAAIRQLRQFAERIGVILRDFCASAGYDLVDFKIEVAYDPMIRGFMLIDGLSLDEMGLVKDGVEYGKIPLRRYYEENHPEWVAALNDAIKKRRPKETWPTIPPLPKSEQKAHVFRYVKAATDFEAALAKAA